VRKQGALFRDDLIAEDHSGVGLVRRVDLLLAILVIDIVGVGGEV